ncbi:MAG: bifunctional 5,10-methylenetetrahydrofolate dehydrogenase/5,10-methenyltetrahydrofolate cyclohydrolase [Candidatus Gracilibacteria bacterium]|nr:bifunctional 5,10-methylenetetrahydrofolate dehydrogenase/5,10-methenyltetrahydrofolate cyclohydrolase [Candidatus Gracilibacteria bacterium]
MIIDGKKIASERYDEIKSLISGLKDSKIKLVVILVGNNPSSLRYIRQKEKWASYVGIGFELIHLDENVSENELFSIIERENKNSETTGILVQIPLPKHIDEKKVINLINPLKDVDGFTQINQGKVLIGDSTGLLPCTPAGVMDMLKYQKIDLVGKVVTVIGKSNIVGKPLTMLLINSSATVISCNSKTKDLSKFTKMSDIVILAAGKPGLLTLEMINNDTIVIDVGFTVVDGKIYGDANYNEIESNGNMITPVPGGVGLLTVVNLMNNVYKSYLLQNN